MKNQKIAAAGLLAILAALPLAAQAAPEATGAKRAKLLSEYIAESPNLRLAG